MRALSTADLLAVWDLAANQSPARRAIALLAAGSERDQPDEFAHLTLGQSDERLLSLHERIFGPRLESLASCPACDETLQFEINTGDLQVSSGSTPAPESEIQYQGYRLHFRLPNYLDIASLDPTADVQTNRRTLLSRCLLSAQQDGGVIISANDLPADAVNAVADRMAQADPQADIQFTLTCPQCGHEWSASFDIASFVWTQLNARALRLLNDVHVLAATYGWREADILSMTQARRQAYVDLATQ